MGDLKTIPTNEYVELWKQIYRGAPDWLNYSYVALTGRAIKRTRKCFKGAKMVCSELIGLMYSERPTIEYSDDLKAIFDRSGWDRKINPFSEKTLAFGGGVFKLFVKNQLIYIDFVPADRFYPVSWDSNGITEADFLDIRMHNKEQYLRVEKHRKTDTGYNVKFEYYSIGTGGMLSKKTAYAMGIKETEEEQKNGVDIITNKPLFSYVYLPEANNLEEESPTGISVYANAVDTLEGLDIAFDALQSEIVLGRKRIIVPAQAVRWVINEDGKKVKYFDPSDEIFTAFEGDDQDQLKITDTSVELRVDEIRTAIQTYLDILSIQVGFSAGYLTFDGQSGLKTATEVISENSKTHRTAVNLSEAFKNAIVELVETIGGLAAEYNVNVGDFDYIYQDNIIEDRASKTAYWTERVNQGTATLEEAIMNIDGLEEAKAKEKANKIRLARATGKVDDVFKVE